MLDVEVDTTDLRQAARTAHHSADGLAAVPVATLLQRVGSALPSSSTADAAPQIARALAATAQQAADRADRYGEGLAAAAADYDSTDAQVGSHMHDLTAGVTG